MPECVESNGTMQYAKREEHKSKPNSVILVLAGSAISLFSKYLH